MNMADLLLTAWNVEPQLYEISSKVWIGKHFSDTVYIQNSMRKEDDSLPVFFIFALEFAIRKVMKICN